MTKRVKYLLRESDMPTVWYNLASDLPGPLPPPLHPVTKEIMGPQELGRLFPASLLEQETSTQRWIDIPGEVLDVYRLWRPSPLYRAYRLEEALKTPARIYYKYEGVSPAGSHKLNTAIAQAYYNRRDKTERLTTETGAGQWGSALSVACSFFNLACDVYMVRVSYEQKPYRRSFMQTYGARIWPSPSTHTAVGRQMLERDPRSPGSLGMAISEAVTDAMADPTCSYALGSVLNHVLLHQTIIGLEVKAQLRMAQEEPDYIVACVGGGSNFAGLTFPFIGDNLQNPQGRSPRLVAVEPAACPTLTRGVYAYDYGDTAGMAPLVKMHTLGHNFVPPPIHAGGLRYHGCAPMVSALLDQGRIEARAVPQLATFAAGLLFARQEGILPAPESNHAIRHAIDLALLARDEGTEPCIVFGLSGHGHFDLSAYDNYLAGHLEDMTDAEERMGKARSQLPAVPAEEENP